MKESGEKFIINLYILLKMVYYIFYPIQECYVSFDEKIL